MANLLGELNRVVQHQIHEGVKTTESAFHLKLIRYQTLMKSPLKFVINFGNIVFKAYLASAIDSEVNPLVHELLKLRWVCLGHLSYLTVDSERRYVWRSPTRPMSIVIRKKGQKYWKS